MIAWIALAAVALTCLWIDLRFFARGSTPTFREGVAWSIGWTVLSLLAALPVLVLSGGDDAVTYVTVYFVERALSLDNLFVLLLVLAYFGIRDEWRGRLLFWAIAAALAFRGVAIVGGVALIDRFQVITYMLGALL